MTIQWGIIGCGNVTENKSGPAFNQIPHSHLLAVMRRDANKAADYAHRHAVPNWYSSADELLNNPEINAVYIATPPVYHLPYALAALKKGKHVYIEKPVTLNATEAQLLAEAVNNSSNKVSIAHYRRALPLFLEIKNLLDTKVIGDVRTVQIRLWQARKPPLVANTEINWRTEPAISGGGYFHDLAPHQLDLMLHYFGTPILYQGFSLNQSVYTEADDNVNGQILFENNITVNGSWCFDVAENEQCDECIIVGTEGSIKFSFFGDYLNINGHIKKFVHPQHIQLPMITKVVEYFRGKHTNPCSAHEAVVLMKIMDAFTQKK